MARGRPSNRSRMTFAPSQYRSPGRFLFVLRALSAILLVGLSTAKRTGAQSAAAISTPHPSPPAITFGRDVAPIIYGSCASCHRPGESGPFSLLSYEDVKKHAHQIVKVTQSHIMPPWLPEAGYGDFAEARRLTDQQIRTIARWVEQGSVLGPPADVPPSPVFPADWRLGPPDLLVEAPQPLDVPATGPEIYWNFLLKPGLTATRY